MKVTTSQLKGELASDTKHRLVRVIEGYQSGEIPPTGPKPGEILYLSGLEGNLSQLRILTWVNLSRPETGRFDQGSYISTQIRVIPIDAVTLEVIPDE